MNKTNVLKTGEHNKKNKSEKCLLIEKLIDDGWFRDKEEAAKWIILRNIYVNNILALDLYKKIDTESIIHIKEYYKTVYVNKGGLKLEGALQDFNIDIKGKTALDCGASTGGFTDCLICHGANLVYAVDAGYGQLAAKLIQTKNVINMEKVNLADEKLKSLDPKPDIITLDLTYLSLKDAIPLCFDILHGKGIIICLVKPIFETDSIEIRRNGHINNSYEFRDILNSLCSYVLSLGSKIIGVTYSHIRGNNQTCEFFIGLKLQEYFDNCISDQVDYESEIETSINEAQKLPKFYK